jgi:predicted DCC family thiol-disulfide oxidoreductase YuxK
VREPAWVFYDGACGVCHAGVRFCLERDADGTRFRYAPIGGAAWRALFPVGEGPTGTLVVREGEDAPRLRSDATLAILRRIGGGWGVVAAVLRVVPRFLRDVLYRGFARVRRALAPAPPETCPVLDPALRARFDLAP